MLPAVCTVISSLLVISTCVVCAIISKLLSKVKFAKKNLEIQNLQHNLEITTLKLLHASCNLYARALFELYEKRLITVWERGKPQREHIQFKRFRREEKWEKFLELNDREVLKFKNAIPPEILQYTEIPETATTLYGKLSEGIHNSFRAGVTEIILDQSALTEEELCLMIAICKAYPLGDNAYKIVYGVV